MAADHAGLQKLVLAESAGRTQYRPVRQRRKPGLIRAWGMVGVLAALVFFPIRKVRLIEPGLDYIRQGFEHMAKTLGEEAASIDIFLHLILVRRFLLVFFFFFVAHAEKAVDRTPRIIEYL